MSIWAHLDTLSSEQRKQLGEDLTVVQLDEGYEKMKKRGKILPGYTPDPMSKIACFSVDSSRNIWIPYSYARNTLKIVPDIETYPTLGESIENEVTLRDPQVEVVERCFNDLVKTGTTTVGLPPGFGKTYIGAFLSHCLRLKVLIVVPRMTLVKQWTNTFTASLPKASIWVIDDKGKIPKEYSESNLPDVIIALDPRISKIPPSWRNKFGTLIIDEAHMLPTRGRIENLLSIQPRYIIMETATMERGDDLHKICHLIGGSHGFFRISKDPYRFKIVDLPFIEVEESHSYRGVDYNSLCNSLSESAEYNRVILNIVRHNPENKFMVLTKRVDHGNTLKNMFISNGITADTLMGTKKTYVNSRVFIGTFSKAGTGFDEATASDEFVGPLSDSMIMCHSVAKTSNFEQYRGRVMRTKNPTVYWLNVKNRVIRSQLTGIKKHVKDTNGTISTIDGVQYMYSSKQD